MSTPVLTQGNARLVRSVARICLLPLLVGLLFACSSSSSSNDPNATVATATVAPSFVTVTQGQNVIVRVDVSGLPANASVAGYSSDLPETVADIDITTQPCPSGVGTVSCQDWTITPGANSIPGDYEVAITPLGATVPISSELSLLRIRVLADPPIHTRPAIAADSNRGRGVRNQGAGSRTFTGLNHGLFISDDGRLWGYGDNTAGQVRGSYLASRKDSNGNDNDQEQPYFIQEPVPIGPASWQWKTVAASGNGPDKPDRGRSFALRDNGTVWVWGRAPQGFIASDPVQVVSLSGINAISAIDGESWLALDSAGQVYGGGDSSQVFITGTHTPLSGVLAIAGGTEGAFNSPTTTFRITEPTTK